ncbi:C2H2 finger domain protein [Aspergillus heteromorphus CBS 117.55]|uniref:C2H2 finger domain protein n=1 Tax=Aspergillus heteromorphus CBS 117.55 TaxID=1448321 RepID=A0A317W6F2_9EURO|nr:C2H2 finger domain protein [Aspergillus heteromorphus CBS 117.55]PWY81933.1 C2H2 finger domain protein [Aspergillus heteromorphus CBS 117.55]
MTESPGSPLSSIASDDDMSDREDQDQDLKQGFSPSATNMPPSKRRRTGVDSWDRNTPVSTSFQDDLAPASPSTSISSDTSGDIPNSPTTLALIGGSQDDDYSGQGNDQVTVCRWDGCDAGDLGNMDGLVKHIHDEHVGSRQKKYSCEWSDCTRKGQTHASGYALRAHMRSHTREKPFYCALPECDRSFTRSDALAKHMRTVHETEALRPSDPVPKHHAAASAAGTPAGTPAGKVQRLKLKLSYPPKEDAGEHSESANDEAVGTEEDLQLPPGGLEKEFDTYEMLLEGPQLYRLLLRQIHWAQQETAELRSAWDKIHVKRKESWMEKEAIFDDLVEAELRLFRAIVGPDGGYGVPNPAPPPNDSPDKQLRQSETTEMDVGPDPEEGSVPP